MKKWIGVMFLMSIMHAAFAQDFKKVETGLLLNNFEVAKTEYEKAVAKKPSIETLQKGITGNQKFMQAYLRTQLLNIQMLLRNYIQVYKTILKLIQNSH